MKGGGGGLYWKTAHVDLLSREEAMIMLWRVGQFQLRNLDSNQTAYQEKKFN